MQSELLTSSQTSSHIIRKFGKFSEKWSTPVLVGVVMGYCEFAGEPHERPVEAASGVEPTAERVLRPEPTIRARQRFQGSESHSDQSNQGIEPAAADGNSETNKEMVRIKEDLVTHTPKWISNIQQKVSTSRVKKIADLLPQPDEQKYPPIGHLLAEEYKENLLSDSSTPSYTNMQTAYGISDSNEAMSFLLNSQAARCKYQSDADINEFVSALRGTAYAASFYRNMSQNPTLSSRVDHSEAIKLVENAGIKLSPLEQEHFIAAISPVDNQDKYQFPAETNLEGVFPALGADADRLTLARPLALHRSFFRLLAAQERNSSENPFGNGIDEALDPVMVSNYFKNLSQQCTELSGQSLYHDGKPIARIVKAGYMDNSNRFTQCAYYALDKKKDKPLETLFKYSAEIASLQPPKHKRGDDLWAFAYNTSQDKIRLAVRG